MQRRRAFSLNLLSENAMSLKLHQIKVWQAYVLFQVDFGERNLLHKDISVRRHERKLRFLYAKMI